VVENSAETQDLLADWSQSESASTNILEGQDEGSFSSIEKGMI